MNTLRRRIAKAPKKKFTVQLGFWQHYCATVHVEAATPEEAERKAMQLQDIEHWAQTDAMSDTHVDAVGEGEHAWSGEGKGSLIPVSVYPDPIKKSKEMTIMKPIETTKSTPTLKALPKGYQLYWPQSGSFLHVESIYGLADRTWEFKHQGKTWQIDGIPRAWDGREIEVNVWEIEPA